jgi:hypothetical protein
LDFALGLAKLILSNIPERRFTSVEVLPHTTLLVVVEHETGFVTQQWSLDYDENHCWSSRLDKLWSIFYPYDLSYIMIHLIVDLWWGFLQKVSFWSNNHSCSNQTRNGTQAVGDPKVSFHLTSPRDLDLARGFEFELFIILVLARKPFSQWSDLHATTSICPQTARLSPKKISGW